MVWTYTHSYDIAASSNLSGEGYSVATRHNSRKMTVTVASIHVYPVKGCRGISLNEAELTHTGDHRVP